MCGSGPAGLSRIWKTRVYHNRNYCKPDYCNLKFLREPQRHFNLNTSFWRYSPEIKDYSQKAIDTHMSPALL